MGIDGTLGSSVTPIGYKIRKHQRFEGGQPKFGLSYVPLAIADMQT